MAKNKSAVTDDELKVIVRAEIANCDGKSGSKLANERAENLDYYFCRPFGNEMDGRSQVVTPDVRDAIEWAMPSLMRMFTSNENVVEFEPEEEGDIESAKQATEYAQFVWNRDNPGWTNTYTWFKDGLLSKNGILKIYPSSKEITKRERYSGLDDATFAKVVNQESVTVSEQTEYEQGGQTFHDLVITATKKVKRVCIDPTAPEEFLISEDARTIEEARLVGDKRERTLSDLIEDGYPKDKVNALLGDEGPNTEAESLARDSVQENIIGTDGLSPLNKAMRKVWVYEIYIKVDVDGDGIAEMRQVTAAGPGYEILRNDAWDDPRPYVSISPIINPHRFVGIALADITKIWQLLRSTIFRQYLDNAYLSNNQREEVVASQVLDVNEALSYKPGQKIRVKAIGTINPIAMPQIGPAMLEGLNYLDQLKENATGLSSRTQGLGADKLHETAKGEQILMTAAMGRLELIGRCYAEGMKEAFKLIHKLNCKYQDQPRVVRLTGKNFIPVDPSSWNADMDMSVSVGLGTGDRDQQMMAAMTIGSAQKELLPLGMVKPEQLLNTAEMIVNAAGQKGLDRFFSLPDPNAPPKPDPEMAKVQAQVQAQQQKGQADAQLAQQKAQTDAQLQAQKTQSDFALKTDQQKSDFFLKYTQMQQELQLKREQLEAELALKQQLSMAEIESNERVNMSASVSDVRPGGEPG